MVSDIVDLAQAFLSLRLGDPVTEERMKQAETYAISVISNWRLLQQAFAK